MTRWVWRKEGYEPLIVEWCKWGIANRYDGGIVKVNRHLKNYPWLLEDVLVHEAKHTSGPANKLNAKDLWHDVSDASVVGKYYLKFFLKHPSAWVQLLPVWYHKGFKFSYDLNLIVIYLFVIGVVVGGLLLNWLW